MKKILYLNGVCGYPTAELHASQKVEIDTASHFKVIGNSYSTRYNHFNPLGRPLTYVYENHRANSVAQFLGLELQKIHINNEKLNLSSEIMDRLNSGVMSSIASYLRVSEFSHLNDRWKTIHHNLLKNSVHVYKFFYNELENHDRILLYNGRFAEDSAAKLAAEMTNTSYKVYDFKKAGSYYEFIDCPLHSVQENCNRAKLYFLENPRRAHNVARNFMDLKLKGITTYEKSYTSQQSEGHFAELKQTQNQIISVFPSSDDEYRFLGADWGVELVKNQVTEILDLSSALPPNFQIIVRMHPNMIDMQRNIYDGYLSLDELENVRVIPADSPASTYELLRESDIIVCFCSTVAVEANYMRKLVINIGGSPYSFIPIVNQVKSGKEAAFIIRHKTLQLKSKTASIIWMNYLWKYYQTNKYINPTGTEDNNKRGSEFKFVLRSSHIYRLLASIDRLELRLKRGSKINRANIREMMISFIDIVTNKYSNKFIDTEKK